MKLAVGILGVAVVALGVLFFMQKQDTVRYVSMSQVFAETNVKQKYEKELKALEEQSNKKLIELQDELNAAKALSDREKSRVLEEQLVHTQKRLTEEFQKKTTEYDALIWKEINEKVTVYGKDHSIDLILGAKGDGAIMYASDAKDITKAVIEFINKGK